MCFPAKGGVLPIPGSTLPYWARAATFSSPDEHFQASANRQMSALLLGPFETDHNPTIRGGEGWVGKYESFRFDFASKRGMTPLSACVSLAGM